MKRHLITVLAALMISPLVLRAGGEKVPDEKCLECHEDKDLTKELPGGKVKPLYVDAAKMKESAHGGTGCAGCHADLTEKHPDDAKLAALVDCAGCHEKPSLSYSASVHGIALAKGNDAAATCKDCHGTHDVFSRNSPHSKIHHAKLVETCGACHEAEAADVAASVHGRATADGETDTPTCIDCHSEHRIVGLADPSSSSRTAAACGKCHASERINSRFGMPADRVNTFFESYHGLATAGGSTLAANCASCHGYHRILPSSDPDSKIHPSHLLETCGKCHPGATQGFVGGKVHVDLAAGDETGMVVNRWVKNIYLVLIVLTVATLGLHNGIAWCRKVAARRRAQGATVIRMDRNQRAQHFILVVGFIVLAVTGFALKFPNTWYAHLMGSEEIRRWIHRMAGLLLIAVGIYHVFYVVFYPKGRRLLIDLCPRWNDLRDVMTNIGHLVLGRPKAKFGRFGYPEKIEYWAVVWGTIVMGATGMAIWLKVDVTRWVPRWVVEVAITIHYYEAILACLAIIVWHFYHVMFDPDVYPMNFAWWDGKVSRKWLEEEHPLDPGQSGSQDGDGKSGT